MPVGLSAPSQLNCIDGIRLATAQAGLKKDADDMLLLEIADGSTVAGVFTTNAYCAAPVTLCREHLGFTRGSRALLINAGNANAGTGSRGDETARLLCKKVAECLEVDQRSVLPFSTGVIGAQLPLDAMALTLPAMVSGLSADNWLPAARAIMTTDIVAKGVSAQCIVDANVISITGIAKGSGMIHPNMATMLAFVATDAVVEERSLQQLLQQITARTFNCITVDGDTSTNDSCIVVATGKGRNRLLSPQHSHWPQFSAALENVMLQLAQSIVRDGEGATRFIEVAVSGAKTDDDCRTIGLTVAHSPLVKTAFFAGDPNLGRILAAIGRSPVEGIDMENVSLSLGDLPVVIGGEPAVDYDEDKAVQIMAAEDISVSIAVGKLATRSAIWTTDLSYDYVKINAEYRS